MEEAGQAARDLIQYCIDNPLKPGEGQYELEARLGRQKMGAKSGRMEFVVSVTPALFWAALRRLKSFKGWTEQRGPFEQIDTFYKVDKNVVRTSLTFEYEGKDEGNPTVTHMCKEKIVWRDVRLPITDEVLGTLCARLCVSIERKVDVPAFVPETRQKRTRVKQRTTFLHNGIWEYACTHTWSGVNRVAADDAMNMPGWNELEIECLSVQDTLKYYKGDTAAMAKSFVLKLLDLAPPGDHGRGVRALELKPAAKVERIVRRKRKRKPGDDARSVSTVWAATEELSAVATTTDGEAGESKSKSSDSGADTEEGGGRKMKCRRVSGT